MKEINLIMPMAGLGSRFSKVGYIEPKPLIMLGDKPFFWWAAQSVLQQVSARIIFVVLERHVEDFQIQKTLLQFYPDAEIVTLPEVTSGAMISALSGVDKVNNDAPIFINDSDHCFIASQLPNAVKSLQENDSQGSLFHFSSQSPNFSYASYNDAGLLTKTVEKQVISEFAIAGLYGFQSKNILYHFAEKYLKNVPYNEAYVSGIYNTMIEENAKIRGYTLDAHFAFGTPDELILARQSLPIIENALGVK